MNQFVCGEEGCTKMFRHATNMYRHKRNVHNVRGRKTVDGVVAWDDYVGAVGDDASLWNQTSSQGGGGELVGGEFQYNSETRGGGVCQGEQNESQEQSISVQAQTTAAACFNDQKQ